MSTFYKPSVYNGPTKEQMWMSVVTDFHDSFCRCFHSFAHILDLIFPDGHRDRDKTIREIIERDLKCHSGGDEEERCGGVLAAAIENTENINQEESQDIADADIRELLAAAESAERR
ncbi:ORF2 [Torque teno midi virus 4]|uniref:ORF2 n=1 Tax=Torque teno midi virus 4 TaxID=2065045 RepID=A8DMP3_9VIRU|nr:ORF2 [Torque teno midi virus 4]ABU55877.1 ORF2 [Torque teno midi virus 4]